MLTRLQAIQDIRLGRGVCLSFVGHEEINGRPHTFRVILRRNGRGGAMGIIECDAMRGSRQAGPYRLTLSMGQVLTFIRLHYPRKGGEVRVQPITFPKQVRVAA